MMPRGLRKDCGQAECGTDVHLEEGAGWALSECMHLGVLE